MTLSQFTSLFPRAQQASPQIKRLYRDLQHQRSLLLDRIATNISHETKRGVGDRLAVLRARREEVGSEQDDEGEVEDAMYDGYTSNLPQDRKKHSLRSVVQEMEKAMEDLEEEERRDEEEIRSLEEEMRGVVGGLSDLRYGRLQNGELREQVLEGLARLESSCERK